MILVGCCALVATACVVASARRLSFAIAPTALAPELLIEALEAMKPGRQALKRVFASDRRFAWEGELFSAFDDDDERRRDARVNEQLLELEGRMERWSRVPRVCASVATSTGFLLATIAVLQGLSSPAADQVAQELGGGGLATSLGQVLSSALAAGSLGIAAMSFCVAAHIRAARACRARLSANDRLVETLQRLQSMSDKSSANS